MIYRFDHQTPAPSVWFSNSQNSIILEERRQIDTFISQVRLSASIYMEIGRYDDQAIPARINYYGAAPVLDEVLAACAAPAGAPKD